MRENKQYRGGILTNHLIKNFHVVFPESGVVSRYLFVFSQQKVEIKFIHIHTHEYICIHTHQMKE